MLPCLKEDERKLPARNDDDGDLTFGEYVEDTDAGPKLCGL
jgi:hypothetical protein